MVMDYDWRLRGWIHTIAMTTAVQAQVFSIPRVFFRVNYIRLPLIARSQTHMAGVEIIFSCLTRAPWELVSARGDTKKCYIFFVFRLSELSTMKFFRKSIEYL